MKFLLVLGSDDKLDSIINLLEVSNQTQSKQLRQDSDQWKADQRVSASEEAAGSGDKKLELEVYLLQTKKMRMKRKSLES